MGVIKLGVQIGVCVATAELTYKALSLIGIAIVSGFSRAKRESESDKVTRMKKRDKG